MNQIQTGPGPLRPPAAVSGSPRHERFRSLWTDPPDAELRSDRKARLTCVHSLSHVSDCRLQSCSQSPAVSALSCNCFWSHSLKQSQQNISFHGNFFPVLPPAFFPLNLNSCVQHRILSVTTNLWSLSDVCLPWDFKLFVIQFWLVCLVQFGLFSRRDHIKWTYCKSFLQLWFFLWHLFVSMVSLSIFTLSFLIVQIVLTSSSSLLPPHLPLEYKSCDQPSACDRSPEVFVCWVFYWPYLLDFKKLYLQYQMLRGWSNNGKVVNFYNLLQSNWNCNSFSFKHHPNQVF